MVDMREGALLSSPLGGVTSVLGELLFGDFSPPVEIWRGESEDSER